MKYVGQYLSMYNPYFNIYTSQRKSITINYLTSVICSTKVVTLH